MTNNFLDMGFWGVLAIVAVWSLFWKGLAMWRAAKLGSKKWFVALLILNTVGILEILYLYVFSKKSGISSDRNA
ncbi:MAG: DUF5652 family protein [Candidatus Paceibacterota bacterium]